VSQAKVSAHFERRFSGHIADLPLSTVRKGASELLKAIDEAPGFIRLFTVDAATLSDLAIIASVVDAQGLLLAGSSGLAEAVARRENSFKTGSGGHSGVVRLLLGRIAFFVGSVTSTSAAQCARLAESDNVLRLVVNGRAAANDPEAEMGRMLDLLRQSPAGKALLIHTDSIEPGTSDEGIKAMGSLISQFLGNLALATSHERNLGFLFAMGGDTAARVAAALGADYIDFTDELLPGLPYGYFESNTLGRRLYFASKSGGFGSADALLEVLARVATKRSLSHESLFHSVPLPRHLWGGFDD
jgi:uncharacterized protein YgbK (DUF1537 family)